jgi:hypothetical protein
MARSLAINILGPYLVYRAAEPFFPTGTAPLLLSMAIPIADFAFVFFRQRLIDVISIITLVQLSVGLAITLVTRSTQAALIGHALQPAALGMVFATSALISRPIIQPLARQSMAGGDPERQAQFDARTVHPAAKRTFTLMTWIWAVALCGESAVLVAAARGLAAHDYLLVSPVVVYGLNGLLTWASIGYGRRRAARAQSAAVARGHRSAIFTRVY